VDGKGQEDVSWRIKLRGRTKSGQGWFTGGNREPWMSKMVRKQKIEEEEGNGIIR
jgi:hypothetical protein